MTWLSSTQEKACTSRRSYETRLPRHTAPLSDVLCPGTVRREREREYDERAAEQTDQEGIIESSRLEQTSKLIKANYQHNIMPAQPRPEVPYLHIFWTPAEMVTPLLPWAPCSNASQLSV